MRAAITAVVLACFSACAAEAGEVAPPNADPQGGCAIACHGSDTSNAPPKALSGAVDTTVTGVGAHQPHLDPAPSWRHVIECVDCHVVPADLGSPGHLDGDNHAELTFSARAGEAMFDGTSCTTRCHGRPELGGRQHEPVWTLVDGTQAACGSCHGTPPPSPHPASPDCAACHPSMEEGSLQFRDPTRHINGVIDVVDPGETGGCNVCHGSSLNAAPPGDLSGNTSPTGAGVGAHQAHLRTSTWRHEITCSSCHVVPATVDAPGHRDGDDLAEVVFDPLNPEADYARDDSRCDNLYCHGNGRGSTGTQSWTTPGEIECGACHRVDGDGLSGRHLSHTNRAIPCIACHLDVVDLDLAITNADLHINGVRDVHILNGNYDFGAGSCSNIGCHGTRFW